MKSFVKSLIIGKKKEARTIRFGVAKGINMVIDPAGGSMRMFGLDETELMPYVKRFSQASQLFLDIGSSDGFYPLIFRKFNSNGEIYSIEADHNRAVDQPSNFQLNNFDTNKLHIIERYIGNKVDSVFTTIDALLPISGRKAFVKIDIEGAEMDALRGAKSFLQNNSCMIIIETHSKDLESQCNIYLQQQGYKTNILNHAWYRSILPESRQIEHNRWLIAQK